MKKTLQLPRFDVLLDTDCANPSNNAELTLTLRLGFRQINPAGGANTGTYNDYGSPTGQPRAIIKWSSSTWTAWKVAFCNSARKFWHGKFWILNTRGVLPFKHGQQVFLPNIWCKFDIVHSDASAGTYHHAIDVVRLAPSETWFGSHAQLYDSLDTNLVQKTHNSAGKPIMQRAHVHEIGHLLGLGHVDVGKPHCPPTGNTNASACYGVSDHDKNSVMGSGMRLDTIHAEPWLTALTTILSTAPPLLLYTPPPILVKPFTALKKRVYPRTTAEFEAGKVLTTLPPGR